jgi:hypothetical protein
VSVLSVSRAAVGIGVLLLMGRVGGSVAVVLSGGVVIIVVGVSYRAVGGVCGATIMVVGDHVSVVVSVIVVLSGVVVNIVVGVSCRAVGGVCGATIMVVGDHASVVVPGSRRT